MRCVGKQKEDERLEFIRKNRREVDRFAGLTDPVDIIRELHTWRKPDPLIVYKPTPFTAVELYAGLTSEQRDRLVALAVETKRSGDKNLPNQLVKGLASLTDFDLSDLASTWVDFGLFSPAVLFRGANAGVRDRVIQFLGSWRGSRNESLPVNGALSALAWIGDSTVHDTFAKWERDPPEWRQHLYVGPGRYAHTGGWELGRSGRRDLVHQSCLRVTALDEGDAGDVAVNAFTAIDQKCPWCRRALVAMLSIDTNDPRFTFLARGGSRLSVLTCDACTCFAEHIFGKSGDDGSAQWHPANVLLQNLPGDGAGWGTSPWQHRPLLIARRRPMQAVESGVGGSASAIGGDPCWVQDSAYPSCPDCGETMMFIAQLDNDDFKYHEGSYYAFLCAKCRVTATCYQQT